ncbi:hypothetical protein IFM89_037789 [Coptis chinensis]|uniref:Glabrous enhancer-binding protein-like DBD domain-containing protein n=1 Tax=Coptis chinensis TaxID=261450 RepID=A0A835HBP3_9MAGN|nr:hypothetical protein IFM89_037789 [Coptis chinensis]
MPPTTTTNNEEEEEEEEVHHNIIIDNEDEDEDEEDLESDHEEDDNDNEDDDEEEETTFQPSNPVPTTAPNLELTFETQQTPIKQEEEQEKKPTIPATPFDDSRRLFQRLWTDEDEIGLLQGFLEYTSQRGGFKNSAYHHDTAPFYDQIKSKLQLDFNKNQLVEKLRRLKKKYRNVMNRISSGKEISFKTPHDQATFEISRKIWNEVGGGVGGIDDDDGNVNMSDAINGTHVVFNAEKKVGSSSRSRKRARTSSTIGVGGEENVTDAVNLMNCPVNSSVPSVIEDTVRSCLSPLFKELMASAINGPANFRGFGGMGLSPFAMNFGGGGDSSSMLGFLSGGEKEVMDEKWRKQQILELEVYSKRVELVQDQIKLALEDLRAYWWLRSCLICTCLKISVSKFQRICSKFCGVQTMTSVRRKMKLAILRNNRGNEANDLEVIQFASINMTIKQAGVAEFFMYVEIQSFKYTGSKISISFGSDGTGIVIQSSTFGLRYDPKPKPKVQPSKNISILQA